MGEQETAVLGGGGIAVHDTAVCGGGGMWERSSAVVGALGISVRDSAVGGGGGMSDRATAVLGGGGMAERSRAVLGGGGITERDTSCASNSISLCCAEPRPLVQIRSRDPARKPSRRRVSQLQGNFFATIFDIKFIFRTDRGACIRNFLTAREDDEDPGDLDEYEDPDRAPPTLLLAIK
jgi:hypothetical protein